MWKNWKVNAEAELIKQAGFLFYALYYKCFIVSIINCNIKLSGKSETLLNEPFWELNFFYQVLNNFLACFGSENCWK